MKRMKRHKQRGVVLLTCLVFLLVLLGMLRYTMTSARMEEQKAGIDYDMMNAREAAQAALYAAEDYIIEQGERFCLGEGNTATDCNENASGYALEVFKKDEDGINKLSLAGHKPTVDSGIKTLPDTLNRGVYLYDTIQNEVVKASGNQGVFWAYVNWGDAAAQVRNSAQSYIGTNGTLPSIECTACNVNSDIKPRFIIERYLPKDLGYTAPGVIFRITAVGFGRGSNVDEMTNVMLQSEYVLN